MSDDIWVVEDMLCLSVKPGMATTVWPPRHNLNSVSSLQHAIQSVPGVSSQCASGVCTTVTTTWWSLSEHGLVCLLIKYPAVRIARHRWYTVISGRCSSPNMSHRNNRIILHFILLISLGIGTANSVWFICTVGYRTGYWACWCRRNKFI